MWGKIHLYDRHHSGSFFSYNGSEQIKRHQVPPMKARVSPTYLSKHLLISKHSRIDCEKPILQSIRHRYCLGGWACFISSICVIGLLTALVGDLASHFGCTVGLKDSVTAISFVALGTSVPDTFASKVAAMNDKYADSSIGNVTGSNAVNVFLGIGIAWSIAALYHASRGEQFKVHPGNLAFSVTMFCVCAFICCTVLMLRRSALVGGELGGPMRYKAPTVVLFVGLWVFYVFMSSLEAYEVIQGF
ncbi:hypothetical protein TNCV_1425251 [Trichonephila clavipes]|nr:hypothetical protein TNCV_1425251 [Trichonephila clavipes]